MPFFAGRHFVNVIESDTQGKGVMLVTADGDADESGEYLKQEWNMRRLVLCQVSISVSSTFAKHVKVTN